MRGGRGVYLYDYDFMTLGLLMYVLMTALNMINMTSMLY